MITTLVAPLDWGLGHATRCIPLIEALRARGAEVCLGGSGDSLALLRMQYPDLPYLELPAYGVRYSPKNAQLGILARQVPRLMKVIRQEHTCLEQAIEEKGIQCCISDNRYGLWSKRIPTAILCHQLALQLPGAFRFLAAGIDRLHHHFLTRFGQVWIPDLPGADNLGGALSHPGHLPFEARYVGLLSRFFDLSPATSFSDPSLRVEDLDLLAVLSGPEPQRSLLEQVITQQAKGLERKLWIVQGKPGKKQILKKGSLTLIPHLPSAELALALRSARLVISRPGYSSLMDYAVLGLRQVVAVPTPGQTEQEYLAGRLHRSGKIYVMKQDAFLLEEAILRTPDYHGFFLQSPTHLLTMAIDSLLSKKCNP